MRSEVVASVPSSWWGRPIAPADLRHDANIFTLLRWLLASAVLFSHGFDLMVPLGSPSGDPSAGVLPFKVSRLAVLLFFSLSGFLVTGSLVKRGVRDFAVARALRLIPGLWMSLLVSVVVLGLFFSAGSFREVLAAPDTRDFLLRNAIILGKSYMIDGVFTGLPQPTTINGSLWTIPQEVRCYVALGLVGVLGALAHRRVLAVLFAAAFVVNLAVPADAVAFLVQPRPLGLAFFFGVLLYLWRDRLLLSWPLAVAVVGLALLIPDHRLAVAAVPLAAAYAALVAAILVPAGWKRLSATIPDYSYGIYIYAFPAQQAALALGIGTTPYANMVTGFALTLPFAALSWHFVEKPALALKPRLMRARQPAAA